MKAIERLKYEDLAARLLSQDPIPNRTEVSEALTELLKQVDAAELRETTLLEGNRINAETERRAREEATAKLQRMGAVHDALLIMAEWALPVLQRHLTHPNDSMDLTAFAAAIEQAKAGEPFAVTYMVSVGDVLKAAGQEYALHHLMETEEDRRGRRATVRGMMVRLGLYGQLDEVIDRYSTQAITQMVPVGPGLCEDEGCEHHGTPHICVRKALTPEQGDEVIIIDAAAQPMIERWLADPHGEVTPAPGAPEAGRQATTTADAFLRALFHEVASNDWYRAVEQWLYADREATVSGTSLAAGEKST